MTFQQNSRSSSRTPASLAALISLAVALPAWAQGLPAPKYSADLPASIKTPDNVQTRMGTLKFSGGLPDADTVQKVYGQLDFGSCVEAFMAGMPAALASPARGLAQAIGIAESLADARSLFLTRGMEAA